MLRDLKASVIAVVVLTAVFGFAYPLVMTGFAQVAFKHKANGSLIKVNGKVVGSRSRRSRSPRRATSTSAPSATAPAYNAAGTTFANLGPTSPDLAKAVAKRRRRS